MRITALLYTIPLLFSLLPSANASLVIDGTRVIFDGNQKDVTVSVENKDRVANLVQSWIEPLEGNLTVDSLIVTPPLFRLSAGERNVIRIIRTSKPLTDQTESMFWLNIKGIPGRDSNEKGNRIQIAVNTRVKLIFRPVNLMSGKPEDFTDKLKWSYSGNNITVSNPTPYYMNIQTISVGDTNIKEPGFVAPNGTKTWNIPATGNREIHWSLISDFGTTGPRHSALG